MYHGVGYPSHIRIRWFDSIWCMLGVLPMGLLVLGSSLGVLDLGFTGSPLAGRIDLKSTGIEPGGNAFRDDVRMIGPLLHVDDEGGQAVGLQPDRRSARSPSCRCR